jgi:uncharacterized protein YbdZ (MbtH family)
MDSMMHREEQEDTAIYYKVVVNHEEQYSIWPAERENPLGWNDVGKSGLKQECLDYIEEVWTDMRPLTLRKQMAEAAQRPEPPPPAVPSDALVADTITGDELVDRLSEGEHPVEAVLRLEKTARALKESIDRGYVHIKFTNTKGGTELGCSLDNDLSDLSQADFEAPNGAVHLVGRLTLNYVKVRCIADIDLKTLVGQGHLEPVET